MKWTFLFAAGLAMLATGAAAQSVDTAQLSVLYKFSYIRDTTNRDKPYTERMVLLVGKKAGLYKSYERQTQQQTTTNPDGSVQTNTRVKGSPVEYYQFPNEKKMVRKDWLPGSDFIISDPLPVLDWHITHDTATFGNLHCQKATTHFKGREYTAWFCPDLPLHVGPWKLNGLPGVIVEAYDAKKEIRFTFDGIDRTDPTAIKVPTKGIKTTDKDFAKLGETARTDPEAFSKLMTAQIGGPQPDGRPGPRIDLKPGAGPAINNPMELPDNK
jgi:GLPGLI family protein